MYSLEMPMTVLMSTHSKVLLIVISKIYFTYLPTYLPTYVPTYLHTYIPTYIPTYLCMYVRTYIGMYIPTYLPIADILDRCVPSVQKKYESMRQSTRWDSEMSKDKHLKGGEKKG